jgi:Holliday junction resolvasome RuvABC endonuclease subunit
MLREFRLSTMPEPHDVADALAIALCHCYQHSSATADRTGRRGVGIRMSALREPEA